MAFLIPFAILMMVGTTGPPAEGAHHGETFVLGERATAVGEDKLEPEYLDFKFGVASCRVSKLGVGGCSDGGVSTSFTLPLGEDDEIKRLYTVTFDRDLLIAYELGDVESAAGTVVRLDSKQWAVKWRAWVPGFNIGVPLLKQDSLFVTAIGFVGRIECATGRYAWQHEDLYQQHHAFNSFGLPRLDGNFIIFPEEVPSFEDRAPKRIRVDMATGAMTIEEGV